MKFRTYIDQVAGGVGDDVNKELIINEEKSPTVLEKPKELKDIFDNIKEELLNGSKY